MSTAGRKRVLWVDDEIEFLRSHIMFLETRGYSVIPVFSGDDALALLREGEHRIDIVLLDEQMPGKDGLTTLEEIKELLPQLPVVMVTKSEEEQVMEDALGKKIDGYLTKPVNPSQILSVCKTLLDSRRILSAQVTRRFIRHYSDNRAALSRDLSGSEWINLYRNLVHWDFELEKTDDEGLRQNHAGQKSDCNAAFARFIMDNYAFWVKGDNKPPLFSNKVVERAVVPLLQEGKNVFFLVMDCMRLDQYLAIEDFLKELYDIRCGHYYSILPTATRFSRRSLFSGLMPDDIAQAYPAFLEEHAGHVTGLPGYEQQMLRDNLNRCGLSIDTDLSFASLGDTGEALRFLDGIDSLAGKRLVTVVVDCMHLLAQSRSTSSVVRELAPDETSFRALTRSWFRYSVLLQIIRALAERDCTLVLTADHGSMLCSRGTELYGSTDLEADLRFKAGEGISSDERHSLCISSPAQYRLPASEEMTTCLLAREDYYFITPDSFHNYQNQYRNSFYYGGVSMEEMIVPFAVMNPRR